MKLATALPISGPLDPAGMRARAARAADRLQARRLGFWRELLKLSAELRNASWPVRAHRRKGACDNGNSASELATELAEHNEQVWMAVRTPPLLVKSPTAARHSTPAGGTAVTQARHWPLRPCRSGCIAPSHCCARAIPPRCWTWAAAAVCRCCVLPALHPLCRPRSFGAHTRGFSYRRNESRPRCRRGTAKG